MQQDRPIYLDHQAHAPIDPRVAEFLYDAFVELDANPHSSHATGERVRRAVDQARQHVAALVCAEPQEIVFTSGATEANNLALIGLADRLRQVARPRIVVSAGEHPSVLAAAAASGLRIEVAPLASTGMIDLAALDRVLAGGAGLASVAWANHEVGSVQPMAAVAERVRSAGALVHSDLAQAAGKVPVDAAHLDLGSVSAHKLGGPMGVGALVVRRTLRRHVRPIMHGGGQEAGIRPGTVPAPLCAAFGEACRLALAELTERAGHVGALRDRLLEVLRGVGGLVVNGGPERLPGNLNVSFESVDGEALAMRLRNEVAISTGSACSSSSLEPSPVLAAIGVTGARAEGAVRISLGPTTTAEDIDVAATRIVCAVAALRATVRKVA